MPQRNRFQHQRRRPPTTSRRANAPAEPKAPRERKPPTQYGKPFVLLEDLDKNTFEFLQGAWTPYAMSIAQCRLDCQVTELPQKVNGKTRYEVRSPLPAVL